MRKPSVLACLLVLCGLLPVAAQAQDDFAGVEPEAETTVTEPAAEAQPTASTNTNTQGLRPVPRWSIALERFANLTALFFSTEGGGEDLGLRAKGLYAGGPIANPLTAPRLAVDRFLDSGWSVGAGLAFGLGDLDSDDRGVERDEGGYRLLMLQPRVGYRWAVHPDFDVLPRAGITFGWGAITTGEYDECTYELNPQSGFYEDVCSPGEGETVSGFAAVLDLEVTAAWRLTDSFNVLMGVAYDVVFAASGDYDEGGSGSTSSRDFDDGHLSSLQLWAGLGGYLGS